jgi:hypothetical protein
MATEQFPLLHKTESVDLQHDKAESNRNVWLSAGN